MRSFVNSYNTYLPSAVPRKSIFLLLQCILMHALTGWIQCKSKRFHLSCKLIVRGTHAITCTHVHRVPTRVVIGLWTIIYTGGACFILRVPLTIVRSKNQWHHSVVATLKFLVAIASFVSADSVSLFSLRLVLEQSDDSELRVWLPKTRFLRHCKQALSDHYNNTPVCLNAAPPLISRPGRSKQASAFCELNLDVDSLKIRILTQN